MRIQTSTVDSNAVGSKSGDYMKARPHSHTPNSVRKMLQRQCVVGGFLALVVVAMPLTSTAVSAAQAPKSLSAEAFKPFIDEFNTDDRELVATGISNAKAWDYLRQNIPFFECPDKELEKTYYFRWWTFRKHIRSIPGGRSIITEFLPDVPWAGKYNSISCAAAHHIAEGRWLHDLKLLDDYSSFWFQEGEPRRYSFPVADALWGRYLVTGQKEPMVSLLPDLVRNYAAWTQEKQDPNGLYWQSDDRDGMEVSVGGSGYRPTINSYQYGDARAISAIAGVAGNQNLAGEFKAKADATRKETLKNLWNEQGQFFETVARNSDGTLGKSVGVREQLGYVPWVYGLPEAKHLVAWKQLTDAQGFAAPYGPTSTERRHPGFRLSYEGHECQWNGPSWPFATSQTLTALANVLNGPGTEVISKNDYFSILRGYALSHRLKRADGKTVFWIDENLNPDTGDWISRTILQRNAGGDVQNLPERGKDYNHSTFCDLVISGLMGLRPRADNTFEVNPLFPASWKYAALDNLQYHGQKVAIFWDSEGTVYGWGRGLTVVVNGRKAAHSATLTRLTATIPPAVQVKPSPVTKPSPTNNLALHVASAPSTFPRVTASFTSPYDQVEQANDGIINQTDNPRSRWTAYGSPNPTDWLQVEFERPQSFNTVALDIFEDSGAVRAPQSIRVQFWNGTAWNDVEIESPTPIHAGRNTLRLPALTTSKIRVTFTHTPGFFTGVSELQVFKDSSKN